MDHILSHLQGQAFTLCPEAIDFLSSRRDDLINLPIKPLKIPGFSPNTIKKLISLHRNQLESNEYINSRISNPTSGTIDHIHAEITAYNGVELGLKKGLSGYSLELLRVAGHLHDSERSYPRQMAMGEGKTRNNPEAYIEFKKIHTQNSVRTVSRLLDEITLDGCIFPDGFKNDLTYLILRHELGGEKKANQNIFKPSEVEPDLNLNDLNDILTYADSFAYMDANILTNWEESNRSVQALSGKVHYMFDRMTPEGQDIIRQKIINSEIHILGKNCPENNDLIAIRSILLDVCGS
ncbi:MAG: HD domain-containing protein [Spirochaetales bacterium]|nr:HD domain-containing protein [Spirochaetales bacterium]